jgi:hypothetical protein
MAGLRRDEIDSLQWLSFLWTRKVIRIERTEHFSPKSEKSLGDIDVDAEIIDIFKEYHAKGERSLRRSVKKPSPSQRLPMPKRHRSTSHMAPGPRGEVPQAAP